MIDSRDTLIAILKEKYEHEYNKKKYFEDTLPIPMTLLIALIGGIYLIINDDTKVIYPNLEYYWLTALILLLGSCAVSIYFLFNVYVRYAEKFTAFPSTQEIVKYYNDLEATYKGNPKKDEEIINAFKNTTIDWYTGANNFNVQVNDKRAASYVWARRTLFIALFFGTLVFLLISITKLDNMAKKQPSAPTHTPAPTPKPAPKPPQVRVEKFSKGGSIKKK